MQQPYQTSYRATEEVENYPEPDYVPAYPWLGRQGLDIGQLPSSNRMRDAGRNLYESISSRNYDDDTDVGRLGSAIDDEVSRSTFLCSPMGDRNDPLIDPDIESSEGSKMSEDQMSEADSDYVSPPAQEQSSLPGRGGKRGRARGRGGRGRGARGGAAWKGIKRGPRRAAEPSQEFKILHSEATTAFIDHDYDKADDFSQRAILANPEMFAAHSLLSEIHFARGDKDKALAALFNGAHTRPKDIQVWSRVADLILERAGEDRFSALNDAIYCYNRIIGVDARNIHARYQRAALNRELGHKGRAAVEYERMLKLLPHDTAVLRHLAEVCIDMGEVERAKKCYDESITYYLSAEKADATGFSWSDVNIYAELFSYLRIYAEGIHKLRWLSRWIAGRGQEVFWDDVVEDDREWDSEDFPRRLQVQRFIPGHFGSLAYGDGLPLELRTKLGIYRLKLGEKYLKEALHHFDWLDAEDDQPGAKIFDYPDLFREAADALREEGLYHEALRFYEPLQQVKDYTDTSFFIAMAMCYRAIGLVTEAEDCYQTIIEHDEGNVEARVHLAKMFEELGMPEQAFTYVNEVILLGRQDMEPTKKDRRVAAAAAAAADDSVMPTMLAHRISRSGGRRPTNSLSAVEKDALERTHDNSIRMLHLRLLGLQEQMLAGNEESTAQWLDAARDLILDFRSIKLFFPWDKYVKFYGYSKEARRKALKPKTSEAIDEMEAMAGRLQGSLGEPGDTAASADSSVPQDYRGISFETWLDILLEYALCLARRGNIDGAYETITVATDANVFFHAHEFMYIIHVCWFTCALIANDEETLCNVARWFMKEYQFSSDSYRLFSALNRLCNGPSSWYNSGPSQKYILRQVKAMDFSLLGDERRRSIFQEKASYTTKDESGKPIPAEEMDVALLMLYGHILYAGTSYSYALNYFFRAFALDPINPMINLSLALGYIHYALKRQSENRHYLVMQGFSFLFAYYDLRQSSASLQEKQEAEYNVARTYLLLGLTHLAVPYYQKCLELSQEIHSSQAVGHTEDFGREAAVALQGIWGQGGDLELARVVTEKWLSI
ncbi:MAG: transcription factor TFIIIC subunit tfc4 [Pleopsidium flavum]|nr:MAG: transcription factor TFIIIC subunit tfc4 [Pleopsidium flavum]